MFRRRSHVLAAFLLTILGISVITRPQNLYETAVYWMHPTAESAFAIAEHHFRVSDDRAYDVDRAHEYYLKAATLDPMHPMALQQLARTSFVRGDLSEALIEINQHISRHPDTAANAYYIRALIYGFQKQYVLATADYRRFISMSPETWPAYNDLAWTLLQSGHASEALVTADQGLTLSPENGWLLTTKAAVLYDMHRYQESRDTFVRAIASIKKITRAQWIAMYPGNDPASVSTGMQTLLHAAEDNLRRVEETIASSTASSHAGSTMRP